MDELEISGKRYLSAKRAAKEHKYHADYIGQLVRNKKVIGQKVGRSWYVEERSLAEYFGKEVPAAPATPATPVYAISNSIPDEVISETPPTPVPAPVHQPEPERAPVVIAQEEIPAAVAAYEPSSFARYNTPAPVAHEHEVAMRVRAETAAEEIMQQEILVEEEDEKNIPVHINTQNKFTATSPALTYIGDEEPLLPPVGRTHTSAPQYAAVPIRRIEKEALVPEDEPEEKVSPVFLKAKNISSLAFIGVLMLVVVAAASTFIASSVVVQDGKPASVEFGVK